MMARFAAKLDLTPRKSNVGTQIIDIFLIEIYSIVTAGFWL